MEVELLASGRDADVYVLDDDRVLRRCRHSGDVTAEVRFMRHVRAHDYPVPAVFRADGADLELAEAIARRARDPALTAEDVRLLDRAAALVSSPRRPGSR